jgi:hypothetical protein
MRLYYKSWRVLLANKEEIKTRFIAFMLQRQAASLREKRIRSEIVAKVFVDSK